MSICIASFPAAASQRTGASAYLPATFLSPSLSSGISSKGNTWPFWTGFTKTVPFIFPASCAPLEEPSQWQAFKNSLYGKDWCPYIKETFNGFGNAIEYLGRYTHKIAISNSRILSVTDSQVTFSARGQKTGEPRREVTLFHQEFIRRFLMHVLPHGFCRIRYYGFLNNRGKARNLELIFTLQGHQRFKARYIGLTMAELLKKIWGRDICACPVCGSGKMRHIGRTYGPS